VHFETEPIVVTVTLPPIGTSLGITLAFDDDYCLCYLASCDAYSLFLQALPPYYLRNIYILTVNNSDPVTVDGTLASLKSCQVLHAMSPIELGIIKRNSHHRTALEEQRAMFNQVRFAPVTVPDHPIPIEPVACRAITAGIKPDTPAHLGDMLKSPYKAEFKAAHFENYDKMYRTGTWSAPVIRSLLPPDAVILPPRSVYAVKPSEVANVYDIQVRTCENGSKIIEGVHYDQSFALVSSIDSIRMMIALGAAQRNTAYTLDISNAFQRSIVFQACKRT
jgi:hypothetical protein